MSFVRTTLAVFALLILAGCGERTPAGRDISTLMSLHRGELAAVASYERIMKAHERIAGVNLSALRDDHSRAAAKLADRIRALGGTPGTSPGIWGGSVELLTAGAGTLGEKASLEFLRVGEKHGQSEYEDALEDATVDAETKALIRAELLPPLAEHIRTLEAASSM
jgi:hypothetical protein